MPIVERHGLPGLCALLLASALSSAACQLQFGDLPISDVTPPRDGGDRDALPDVGSPGEAGQQVMHPACNLPFPRSAPAEPDLPVDPTGRPAFDWWRDVDCEQLSETPACSSSDANQDCAACLGEPPRPACATSSDSDLCFGPSNAVAAFESQCTACLTVESKARACCGGGSGVDCRPWPFEGTSAVRGLCARHTDCEPGLLCSSEPSWTFGVCTCPERLPELLECAR